MDELFLKEQVASTGRLLLEEKLVARTWGNFSARLDGDRFAITPSGLGYEHMEPGDIVSVSIADCSYEGSRKPSSEKGIHAVAYRLFPEVGFVIHTHQCYATALGLTGPDWLTVTDQEQKMLGGVAWAKYGLPGTKKLKNAVAAALGTGAHAVLMAHHGALICGTDRKDAINKASMLEAICHRSCRREESLPLGQYTADLLARIRAQYPGAQLETGDAARAWSALGIPLPAQLDDAAQMIGPDIPHAEDEARLLALLKSRPAVFYRDTGAVVLGDNPEDTEALGVLVDKAAVSALHTRALGKDIWLGLFDSMLMHFVYRYQYSKKKRG